MSHFFHSASKALHHHKDSEADKEQDVAASEETYEGSHEHSHEHNHHFSIEGKFAHLTARGVHVLENDLKKGVDLVKKHNAAAHEANVQFLGSFDKHHHLIVHGGEKHQEVFTAEELNHDHGPLLPEGTYFKNQKAADAAMTKKAAGEPKDFGESKDAEAKGGEVAGEAKAVQDPKEADGEAKKGEAPKEVEAPKEGSEANEGEDSKGAEETKELEAPKETEDPKAAEESKEGEAAPEAAEESEPATR